MEIFFAWFVFAILAGAIANSRGRSFGGYFLLSIVFSPLIGLIAVLAMPALNTPAATAAVPVPTPDTHVKCPDCRELVLKDARKCKHCGCTLIPITD